MDRSQISLRLAFIFLLGAYTSQAEVNYKTFTIEQAKVEAKEQHKKIFVVFSNLECSPCRWMETNVYSDSLLASTLNDNFIAVKSNGYTITGKYEVMHYKVQVLPTMIFFDENGLEIYRIEGKRDKTKMNEITSLVLSGSISEITIIDQKRDPIPLPKNNDVILPKGILINTKPKFGEV